MNLAGRMLLMVLIIDVFLFFGMGAVDESTVNYGKFMSPVVNMTGSINHSWGNSLVNTNTSGDVVPEATQTWANFNAIFNSIFGFISLMFAIATAPFILLSCSGGGICAPLFAQILVGGAYIALFMVAVVQLISGRAA